MRNPGGNRAGSVVGALATAVLLTGCSSGDSSSDENAAASTSPSTAAPTESSGASRSESPFTAIDRGYAVAVGAAGTRRTRWAARVRFTYNGEDAGSAAGSAMRRPSTWERCPTGATRYAERACPVSALTQIRQARTDKVGVVTSDSRPGVVGCVRTSPLRQKDRLVTLRPGPKGRDCFSDFAVTLLLDSSQRVTGVDVVLSSP